MANSTIARPRIAAAAEPPSLKASGRERHGGGIGLHGAPLRALRGFFGAAAAGPRRLARDSRGTAVIEFAMISTVLITSLIGIVEFSLVMLAQNTLEAATNVSSRLGKTGYTDAGLTREETILAALEDRAGAIIDTDQVDIESKAYDQFDQIGKPEPWNDANADGIADEGEYTDINLNGQYDADMGASGSGDSDDVVVYTVSYPWRFFTPLIGDLVGDDGVITLTARSVVKNEPF